MKLIKSIWEWIISKFKEPSSAASILVASAIFVAGLLLGGIIMKSLIIAGSIVMSFMLLFNFLPKKWKIRAIKIHYIIDAVFTLGLFLLSGSTLTGIVTVIFAGILMSASLVLIKEYYLRCGEDLSFNLPFKKAA